MQPQPFRIRQGMIYIYKYSCVENDRLALGKTLDTLQPGQMEEIVKRLSEKGYNVRFLI